MVQTYMDRFNKEAMKVPKHGLRSFPFTKVLATKYLHTIDVPAWCGAWVHLMEINVQSKHDHLDSRLGENNGKKAFRQEQARPSIQDQLSFSYNKG